MRRHALPIALLTATLGLGACTETADGPDLTGVWRVTLHTHNITSCNPGPQITNPPYIKFTRESIFGQEFYQYVHCSDAGITCEASNGLFGLAYAQAIAGGWKAVIYVASGDATSCSLAATVSTAIVGGDGSLSIETRHRAATDLVGADCTTNEAEKRSDAGTLPCDGFEALTAVRE